MVLREALSNRAIDWTVIGFIDDDLHKRRTSVRGVPVLGTLEEVAPLLASGQVRQVVVSTGSVQRERLDALQRLCADAGVAPSTPPSSSAIRPAAATSVAETSHRVQRREDRRAALASPRGAPGRLVGRARAMVR